MGHYDDAREAQELVERKRIGARMKAWVANLSDDDAGQLREELDVIFAMRNKFIGNLDQTETFARRVDNARKILGI